MKTKRNQLFFLPVLAILLTQCMSPTKLYDQGRYEEAFEKSLKKVSKNPNANPELYMVLANSYEFAQGDLAQKARRLMASGQADRWLGLVPVYQEIRDRQHKLFAYLPNDYVRGLDNPFIQFPADSLLNDARNKSARYCKAQAGLLFKEARTGNKLAAREAYGWLEKGLTYTPGDRELDRLSFEMRDLGTVRIAMKLANVPHPGYFVLADNMRQHQPLIVQEWTEIHYGSEARNMDYEFVGYIQTADASFDQEDRNIERIQKEVEEGTNIVEEERQIGDSIIVVDKVVPKTITVNGKLITVTQTKEATVTMGFVLYDTASRRPISRERFSSTEFWSNEYQIYKGDSRANPGTTGSRAIFPTESSMIFDAGYAVLCQADQWVFRYFNRNLAVAAR